MTAPTAHATYRVIGKHGTADCAVATLAMALRQDYEAVLIAAAKINAHVWTGGLHATDILKIAKRLGAKKAKWSTTFDAADSRGVLWISHRDSTKEHCVFLLDGLVFDPDHDPVSVWDYEDYCAAQNTHGHQLLRIEE